MLLTRLLSRPAKPEANEKKRIAFKRSHPANDAKMKKTASPIIPWKLSSVSFSYPLHYLFLARFACQNWFYCLIWFQVTFQVMSEGGGETQHFSQKLSFQPKLTFEYFSVVEDLYLPNVFAKCIRILHIYFKLSKINKNIKFFLKYFVGFHFREECLTHY